MTARKVISKANLPARFPIWQTVTCAIALDYWKAPLWLIACFGVYFLVSWVICISDYFKQEITDVFNKEDEVKLMGIGH